MKTGKKLLSILLCLIMLLGIYATSGNVTANATGYDPNAALAYAKNHWNDGKGDCQAFVKACLKAGGVTITSGGCYNVYKALKNGGYGTLYKLTSTGNQYKFSNNSGKVSKGDPMFFVCTTCGGTSSSSAWPHVVLCGEGSGGYITDYAHNSAHNGATHKLWKDLGHSSHPNHTMEVYSFHMNASPQTPPAQVTSINGLKSTYSVGETLSVSWPAASGATSYKVSLMPMNGTYGETKTVTSTSYSKNFSKPEDYSIRVDSVNSAGTTTGLTHYFSVVCTNHVRGSYHHMDDAHPHYKYYSCSVCGAVFRTSETGYVSYCNTCNPQYTLQYDANGGTGAPDKFVGNGSINLSTVTPSRDGYYFLGWATGSSATTAQYQPGASFTLNGSKTLYAVWDLMDKAGPSFYSEDISYYGIVNHQINAIYIEFSLDDESKVKSANCVAYQTELGSNYSKSYNSQIYEVKNHYVCFFEIFKEDFYDLTGLYNLRIVVQDEWGNETVKEMNVILPSDEQVRHIYYNSNGADSSWDTGPDYTFVSDDGSLTLRKDIPTKRGYIFLGWSTESNAIEAQYKPGDTIYPTNDLYLYAVWKYNENPSKGDVDGNGKISLSDVMLALDKANGVVNLSANEIECADINNDSVVDLTDVSLIMNLYLDSNYTINYNSNNENGAPRAQTDYGNIQLSNTIPSRSGYRFLGWATSPTAKTAQYQPGDTFSLLDNTVLFAVWEKVYTLTYNANGGRNAPTKHTSISSGGRPYFKISKVSPERTGYSFLGWAETASASKPQYYPEQCFLCYGDDVTLYAVWETYKCEFCGQLNKTWGEYDKHLSTYHSFKCEYCDLYFSSKEALNAHTDVCPDSPNPTASAKLNAKSSTTVDYRSKVNITATASGVPDGYFLAIYSGNTLLEKGTKDKVSYTPKDSNNKSAELKSDVTYTVKVIDGKNAVQKDSNGKDLTANVEIKVKQGFFDKLIAFFKGLFGLIPTVEIKP